MSRLPDPIIGPLDLETLVGLCEIAASRDTDGHLTILRYTTGWKVMLGTPDLRSGEGSAEIDELESFGTLKEALVDLLIT